MDETVEGVGRLRDAVLGEVRKVVSGQDEALELMLVGLVARGHVLLEGVPGTAKTLMAKAIAKTIDASFRRIQFTPDLMPSDVVGTSVFNLGNRAFELHKGPVFTDILLADEVNRAPAKTQSALLQAMEERRVTIDGEDHTLAPIFTVFATQNPVEFEGTYPLPEAQLDRFLLKVRVGYPSTDAELEMLRRYDRGFDAHDLDAAGVRAVAGPDAVLAARRALDSVRVEDDLLAYLHALVASTRASEALLLGAGPRAAIHLLLCAKALAILAGRAFVTPDDIRRAAPPVLRHRLLLEPEVELDGTDPDEVVQDLLARLEVPR